MIRKIRVQALSKMLLAGSNIKRCILPSPTIIQRERRTPSLLGYFSTQKQLNQVDLDYLKTLSDEAEAHYSKQQFSKARQSLLKSADVLRKIYGEKSADYARVINNIGITYKIERKFNEAIQYINKSISIIGTLEGNYENEKAYAFGELGQIYYVLKNYEKANIYVKDSTQILSKNKLYTIELVSLFDILGNIQKERGKLDKAIQAFENSIKTFEKLPGRQPVECLQTLNELGRCYMKLGRHSEGLKTYQRIYDI